MYQQAQRWPQAGVFRNMVRDLRMLTREIDGRAPQPRAAILDSRMLQRFASLMKVHNAL